MRTDRVEFLDLAFDRLTFRQVKDRLRSVTAESPYGYVITPNVDHIVRLRREPDLQHLYDNARLCVCDSRILRFLARLSGINLPLVPGSDLAAGVLSSVVKPSDRIAVIGATNELVDRLLDLYPHTEIVHHTPPMGLRANAKAREEAAKFIASSNARFTFLTVGSPQQELIANEARTIAGAGGMALCVGAGLEFLTGEQKRAPRALQNAGLEWAYRLANNPRRLGRRYLIEGPRIFPIYLRWLMRGQRRRWVAAGAALVVLLGLAFVLRGTPASRLPATQSSEGRAILSASAPQPLNLPPPDLLRPLSPEEAARENSERPFVKRPDSPAAKFVLKAGADDREKALNCLTQAVYYEAASEGAEGERAVAQVVLNRMHHPGYPASVCGVVYQGAERGTGCQFTFACDGSLLRSPIAALWTSARKIAAEAISGKVFAAVGHATHYHADYVLPYWADSLDKTVQIGRHIFYRLRKGLGDRNAFVQRYAGAEPEVRPPNATVILPESAMTEQLAGALISDNLIGAAKDVEKAAQPTAPPLAADIGIGSLIADGQAPAASQPRRKKTSNDCAVAGENKQLSPMGKSEMRANGASSGC